MIDTLFQIGFSNALIALALAAVALIVEATARRPAIAHLLWLLVFVKLITPSFAVIPLETLPAPFHIANAEAYELSQPGLLSGGNAALEGGSGWFGLSGVSFAALWNQSEPWLAAVWVFGSLIVLAFSLWRINRFHRFLGELAEDAPATVLRAAEDIAARIGLKQLPRIRTASAAVSPLVWWAGGRVQVVIPDRLVEQFDDEQLQWLLGHELAHVRRGDHFVRWIEWLACVCCWWNPLVWWARSHLRANEEICCDALVVSCLSPQPREYAYSLLTVIETLAQPAVRPPVVASEMSSGGFLERRLKVIISGSTKKTTAWVLAGLLLCALIVLPLSFAISGTKGEGKPKSSAAEQKEVESKEQKIKAAVKAGELTPEEAEAMLKELHAKTADEEGGVDWAAEEQKIKAAVEAGELTPKEAEAKLNDLHERMADEHMAQELAQIGKKLKQAVTDGKLTPEEAKAKLKDAEAEMTAKRNAKKWDAVEREIKEAVKSGTMTPEEAESKLKALQASMASKEKAAEWAAREKEIKAAVEAGKLTPEEADAKLKEIEAQIAGEQEAADLAAIEEKLQAAVEAGELTPEEAEAKLAKIKEKRSEEK